MPLEIDNREEISFVGDFLPNYNNIITIKDIPTLIGNLECTISSRIYKHKKAYSIVIPEHDVNYSFLNLFAAINIANNHVYDAGHISFNEMTNFLLQYAPGTQFYGTIDKPYAIIVIDNVRYAIIGCLEFCRARGDRLVKQEDVKKLIIQIRDSFEKVYITPHWGKEGEFAFHPSPAQRKLAKCWIDAGADGVFGSHTHTFHGAEIINNRPIYYSLGNFYFNHEESLKHTLTDYSLLVTVWPHGSWSHIYLKQRNRYIFEPSWKETTLLNSFFKKISKDLSDPSNPWTVLRWAKTVGPTYISKSSASWKLRFGKRFSLVVLLLWAIWNVLPTTLIMRFGALVSDNNFPSILLDIGNQLNSIDDNF